MPPPIERHPLQPFLPDNARLLMLGSFPPPQERWCMPFYYPNPQNDMWRVIGQVFFNDTQHFVTTAPIKPETKASRVAFRYEDIITFCRDKGIAIFDTAQAVRRLKGNAADEHLEIVERTDIAALLRRIPLCHDICCTGSKALETLCTTLQCPHPKVGEFVEVDYPLRQLRAWRMPSTSRAYPLPLDKKAAAYRIMFSTIGML